MAVARVARLGWMPIPFSFPPFPLFCSLFSPIFPLFATYPFYLRLIHHFPFPSHTAKRSANSAKVPQYRHSAVMAPRVARLGGAAVAKLIFLCSRSFYVPIWSQLVGEILLPLCNKRRNQPRATSWQSLNERYEYCPIYRPTECSVQQQSVIVAGNGVESFCAQSCRISSQQVLTALWTLRLEGVISIARTRLLELSGKWL